MSDPTAPLTTTRDLKVGDVLVVARQLADKRTGDPFWWKSFRVVLKPPINRRIVHVMTLKMHPEPDKDFWDVDLTDDKNVVTLLPEDMQPQGVIAMRMKHILSGLIKLEAE